ncbi:MAG: hypothetical protein EPN17_03250 [Methylobacter sp.]|nr:MAG: hypothetical protein EPN17_03250 [Methylobacter sp.]
MYRLFILSFILLTPSLAQSSEPIALPPRYILDGRDTASLSAEWWKWAMASPEEINPVRDVTGKNCAVSQTGNVWFLAGGFGSSKINRTCTIPADKYVFFPVVNMSYWSKSENNGFTCKTAINNAALNNDTALDLFVELDGIAMSDVKNYRAKTKECFNIFERVPKEFDPYNAFPSASDGFWVLLKPLSKGTHTIKFGGRYNRTSGAFGRMVQDIEYQITIK